MEQSPRSPAASRHRGPPQSPRGAAPPDDPRPWSSGNYSPSHDGPDAPLEGEPFQPYRQGEQLRVLIMRKLIAWAFMYSLDGLLADEDTEYWQFCFGLPVD